jgi:hypothetical protein
MQTFYHTNISPTTENSTVYVAIVSFGALPPSLAYLPRGCYPFNMDCFVTSFLVVTWQTAGINMERAQYMKLAARYNRKENYAGYQQSGCT